MTTIETGSHRVTLINIFTVTPDKQDALLALLDHATDQAISRQKGFISANIHRSLDGTKIANYAQWASRADFEAMQQNPECARHMQAAGALAEHIEPVLYEVESVHD